MNNVLANPQRVYRRSLRFRWSGTYHWVLSEILVTTVHNYLAEQTSGAGAAQRPSLIDRKRHIVGSLTRCVAAAAIGTAWSAAARVGHRDLRHASSGNVCSGDHDAKRVRHRVGRVGLRRSVPIHHCVPVKVAAGDRQGETRTTVKLAGRHDCRNDRNNAGLCHLVRATVPAAKGCQS